MRSCAISSQFTTAARKSCGSKIWRSTFVCELVRPRVRGHPPGRPVRPHDVAPPVEDERRVWFLVVEDAVDCPADRRQSCTPTPRRSSAIRWQESSSDSMRASPGLAVARALRRAHSHRLGNGRRDLLAERHRLSWTACSAIRVACGGCLAGSSSGRKNCRMSWPRRRAGCGERDGFMKKRDGFMKKRECP